MKTISKTLYAKIINKETWRAYNNSNCFGESYIMDYNYMKKIGFPLNTTGIVEMKIQFNIE